MRARSRAPRKPTTYLLHTPEVEITQSMHRMFHGQLDCILRTRTSRLGASKLGWVGPGPTATRLARLAFTMQPTVALGKEYTQCSTECTKKLQAAIFVHRSGRSSTLYSPYSVLRPLLRTAVSRSPSLVHLELPSHSRQQRPASKPKRLG